MTQAVNHMPFWIKLTCVVVETVALCGCTNGDYEKELPNGYRLIRTNANTVAIWSPEPHSNVVVPAKIVAIGVHGDIVFGCVTFDPYSDPVYPGGQPENASGYFILETKTGNTALRMKKESWVDALAKRGIGAEPKMRSPSSR